MKKDSYSKPYELKDTFEDGSFSGWTSYPMVQDYGYNPSFSPKKEILSGKEKYVLWCQAQAYYPGTVRLGFIKKIDFLLNSDSSVQFKYHLKSYEPARQIRFCFVSANGKYIELIQKQPKKDKWQDFKFSLKNKIPKNKSAQILSIFIEAEICALYADESYELKIDDVYVKALSGIAAIAKINERLQIPQDLTDIKSPFLYFGEEDRKTIQKNLRDKEVNEIYQNIIKRAEETRNTITAKKFPDIDKLDDEYFLFGLDKYFEEIMPVAEMAELNAFDYFMDKNEKAFKAVKNTLLTMSSWREFHHPWIKKHGQFIYYAVGETSQKLAFGYDIIASKLNSDERKRIALFFLNTFVIPAYKEYYLHDRIPAKSSNWEAHILSGAILSGLTVLNDIKKEKIFYYLIPLIKTLKKMLGEYLLKDGSSAESIGYLAMTLKSISKVVPALKRVLNIDLAKECNIEGSLKYTMYCSNLSYGFAQLDYGDIGPYPEYLDGLAYFVKNSSNQITRFLWQNYKQKEISDIIWHTPEQSVSPEKKLSSETVFHKKGVFVHHSSWDKDCLFFSFHCGPFFNHAYADNGSFYLYYKGDLLIGEPGAGYIEYYANPYYNSYFTQGIGHNTLLVDDNPISQKFSEWPTKSLGLRNFPGISDRIFSDELNFVSGDLSSVYDDLKNYNRSILQIKPGEFLVIDRLKHVDHKPAHYSQLFHPGALTTSNIENGSINIEGKNSLLAITPIFPNDTVIEKHSGHIPLRDYQMYSGNELHKRYYFKATTSRKQVKNLLLSHMSVSDKGAKNHIPWQKIALKKGIGIKKTLGKSLICLYFSSSDGSGIKDTDIDTDAEICGIFSNPNNQQKIFFHKATYLFYKGKKIVESKKPITGLR